MKRIEKKFEAMKREGRKGFIPYITAGDPDLETTRRLILELERSGADCIELGVPFSDPMADGPVIQRASERALLNRVSARDCLELIGEVRKESDVPIVLFSYFNPLLALGFETLGQQLAKAGVDGVLVTDLVPEEAGDLIANMRKSDVDTIFLIAPTSTDERLKHIAESSTGFVYAVSRTGVTGVRETLSERASSLVGRVRKYSSLPVAVGFGVSTPEQVREVWQYADAAVIGSRIVLEIEQRGRESNLVEGVGEVARWLISA